MSIYGGASENHTAAFPDIASQESVMSVNPVGDCETLCLRQGIRYYAWQANSAGHHLILNCTAQSQGKEKKKLHDIRPNLAADTLLTEYT